LYLKTRKKNGKSWRTILTHRPDTGLPSWFVKAIVVCCYVATYYLILNSHLEPLRVVNDIDREPIDFWDDREDRTDLEGNKHDTHARTFKKDYLGLDSEG
jgi:hypothetical protein